MSRNQFPLVTASLRRQGVSDPKLPAANAATNKRVYSVNEFCELYGISRSAAYDEMKEGRLKFRKCGRRRLIGADDAEDWWHSLEPSNAAIAHEGQTGRSPAAL